MQRLVDLEMPIVAAVNGPASVHGEYVLIADIVIAGALRNGGMPCDGAYSAAQVETLQRWIDQGRSKARTL